MENDLCDLVRRTVLARLEWAQHAGVQQIAKAAPAEYRLQDVNAPSPQSRLDSMGLLDSVASPKDVGGGQNVDAHTSPEDEGPKDEGESRSAGASRAAKERRSKLETRTNPSSAEDMPTADTLPLLQAEVAACTLCHELAETRNQTVFGVGDPNARLCFLGEAPGADEDRLGEPFVGRAGKLLTDIIQNGMKLNRTDVYILNILKCRPPANRNPAPNEAANCRPFLLRQMDLIRPEFICCLGAVAAQNLLETTTPIGRLRGSVHDWRGIRVVCTYHPAYLLRNPSAKARTWEDIQLLMRAMGG